MGAKTSYLEGTTMQSVADIIVQTNISVKEALQKIDESSKQILLVIDNDGRLLGTLNDGDIRRGLLKGASLDSIIESIYFRNPAVANINDTKESIIRLATAKKIHQIPIVDANNKPIGLETLDRLISKQTKTTPVVLMAGGLGTRLGELTKSTPKPMLPVGNKPILETIIENFATYGYVNFIISVNYLSNIIEEYFGDGKKFGVNITYIHENQRMGTAGALTFMRHLLKEPFFVMNADLLTNINFEHFHNFHLSQKTIATMGVRNYDFQIPYGVVNINNGEIISISEKPKYNFSVSAGIYMLSPEALNFIPDEQFFDMPSLFELIIASGQTPVSFPIHDYWLDVGRLNDYEQANSEFDRYFDV